MTLDEILNEWYSDSQINEKELSRSALSITGLHQKYYRILIEEQTKLLQLEAKYKQYRHQKKTFYTEGPNEDTPDNWLLPPSGRVPRSIVEEHLDADDDIITHKFKLDIYKEKIKLLESILKMLIPMGHNIRVGLEFLKFKAGAV